MGEIEQRWVGLQSPTFTVTRHVDANRPVHGVYSTPAGTRPKIGLITMHHGRDFSDHWLAGPLAERGLGLFGFATRYCDREESFELEHSLIDIGVGVKWLREEAGAETVVLLGNGASGCLFATYQHQATDPDTIDVVEHLRGTNSQPSKVDEEIRQLPPADLFVTLNAHQGRADVWTNWCDPAVVDESDPGKTDPELDMFDPDNGPPYSAEFIAKYRAAQVARNERITAWVKDEQRRLAPLGIENQGFMVHRSGADLRFLDLSIDPSTRRPGTYNGGPDEVRIQNLSNAFGQGTYTTLRTWLAMWSLEESQCRAAPHIPHVTIPALVSQGTNDQGVFKSDAQAYHDGLGSEDKTLEFLEGGHCFEDNPQGRTEIADLIETWTTSRSA